MKDKILIVWKWFAEKNHTAYPKVLSVIQFLILSLSIIINNIAIYYFISVNKQISGPIYLFILEKSGRKFIIEALNDGVTILFDELRVDEKKEGMGGVLGGVMEGEIEFGAEPEREREEGLLEGESERGVEGVGEGWRKEEGKEEKEVEAAEEEEGRSCCNMDRLCACCNNSFLSSLFVPLRARIFCRSFSEPSGIRV